MMPIFDAIAATNKKRGCASIDTPSFVVRQWNGLIFHGDGLVLRHEGLHDAPADEVSDGTDAEHHHVGGGLAFEAEEREGCTLSGCPVEETT